MLAPRRSNVDILLAPIPLVQGLPQYDGRSGCVLNARRVVQASCQLLKDSTDKLIPNADALSLSFLLQTQKAC